jgi:hypothetical protein
MHVRHARTQLQRARLTPALYPPRLSAPASPRGVQPLPPLPYSVVSPSKTQPCAHNVARLFCRNNTESNVVLLSAHCIRRKRSKKPSNDAILRRFTENLIFSPFCTRMLEPGGELSLRTNAHILMCVNDIGTELQKIGKMLTDSAVEHSTVCRLCTVLQQQLHALSTSEQALALQVLQYTQLTRNTTHTVLSLALVNTQDHRESACLYMR